MRFLFCFIVLFIVSSCCQTHIVVTYQYNGTTIKRIDECGVSTFYYGEISDRAPRIWAEYSGINDGFAGYLVFGKNGKVKLLSGDGYFQSNDADTSKFQFEEITYESPLLGKGVYYVKLATKFERRDNSNSGSGIQAVYEE